MESILLKASAGSGKTSRLTREVFERISAGGKFILALTFTRAATAEMRSRIMELIASEKGRPLLDRMRLIMEAGRVGYSTIDAFFYRLFAAVNDAPRMADEKAQIDLAREIEKRFRDGIARSGAEKRLIIAARILNTDLDLLWSSLGDEQTVERCLLEMERLYNHVADFGAICNDTGFAFAHSQCFRIRERLLRLNKRLTGNRLLRGGIVPGGVGHDLPADLNLAAELAAVLADFNEVVAISLDNSMVRDRLDGAGRLTQATAADHGVLGYVARASNLDIDARRDHPFAAYGELSFAAPVYTAGDVHARTMARVEEVRAAVRLIQQALTALPPGPLTAPLGALPAWEPAFGLVEGWRGAILHWVMADTEGKLYRVKVRDPSFVNWPALSFALLNNIVPDFPLCNKSFNQSYSGNDL